MINSIGTKVVDIGINACKTCYLIWIVFPDLVCSEDEITVENGDFLYPGTRNPETMFVGAPRKRFFPRRKDTIIVDQDFPTKSLRIVALRFKIRNVFSVTVRVIRKRVVIEETVSSFWQSDYKFRSCITTGM